MKSVELIRDYLKHYPPDLFPNFTVNELNHLSAVEKNLVTRAAGIARRGLCERLLAEITPADLTPDEP